MSSEAETENLYHKKKTCFTVNYRNLLFFILDIILVNFAAIGALALRFDFRIPHTYFNVYLDHAVLITFLVLVTNQIFNLYNSIWKYASIDELTNVIAASFVASTLFFIIFSAYDILLPRSFHILFFVLNILFLGGIRFTYRLLRKIKLNFIKDEEKASYVLVIGGGTAGAMVIKEMQNNPQIHKIPVAIIDDDKTKHNKKIHGVPIVGDRNNIIQIVKEKMIDEIIIAMPSSDKSNIRSIINICKHTKCKLKTLPGVYELIDGRVDIKKIRDVKIEDLLGREPVKTNFNELSGYIQNEVVLITGGGGSIGSELCRQVAKLQPKKLLVLDIYENNVYDMQNELLRQNKDLNVEILIASIRDRNRMEEIFEKYRPSIVFHAAAHKHVPLMETNPSEAIKNNIFGTKNVADMANKYNAKRFILISTDKAVNPTNIMGATKRVAEMIIQSIDKKSRTEFVAVRFGNVLGSNGSVIPLFNRQIEEGGPITVTHPDIIRYFMTIPEAVQLVIQAGALAKGGEIFVLDMGDPVKIVDLAKDLIKLSGFEPDKDIKIEFTGLRSGEKLYEEMFMLEEGLLKTKHNKIFIVKPIDLEPGYLDRELDMLSNILGMQTKELIETTLKRMVPTYIRVS